MYVLAIITDGSYENTILGNVTSCVTHTRLVKIRCHYKKMIPFRKRDTFSQSRTLYDLIHASLLAYSKNLFGLGKFIKHEIYSNQKLIKSYGNVMVIFIRKELKI